MSTAEEIAEHLQKMPQTQQLQVLEFAEGLSRGVKRSPLPPGARVEDLLKLAGSIPPGDLKEMQEAIDAGCEQINPNGW